MSKEKVDPTLEKYYLKALADMQFRYEYNMLAPLLRKPDYEDKDYNYYVFDDGLVLKETKECFETHPENFSKYKFMLKLQNNLLSTKHNVPSIISQDVIFGKIYTLKQNVNNAEPLCFRTTEEDFKNYRNATSYEKEAFAKKVFEHNSKMQQLLLEAPFEHFTKLFENYKAIIKSGLDYTDAGITNLLYSEKDGFYFNAVDEVKRIDPGLKNISNKEVASSLFNVISSFVEMNSIYNPQQQEENIVNTWDILTKATVAANFVLNTNYAVPRPHSMMARNSKK